MIGPKVVANSKVRLSGRITSAVPFSEGLCFKHNLSTHCFRQRVKIGSSLLWDAQPAYMLHDAVQKVCRTSWLV